MKNEKYVATFLVVFEHKLNDIRKQIKKELDKPKKERSKQTLKHLLRSARSLTRTLKKAKTAIGKKCPHCGGDLV